MGETWRRCTPFFSEKAARDDAGATSGRESAHDRSERTNVILASITVYGLRGFLGERAKTLAAASMGRQIATIRSFFRFLRRKGHLLKNPAESLASPKMPKKLPLFLSVDAAKEVVEAPRTDDAAGLRDRAMLELCYGCGLRVSEVCGLDLDAVDPDRAEARVTGKGKKERIVPVGRSAMSAVSAYLAVRDALVRRGAGSLRSQRPEDARALFLSTRGRRMNPRGVQLLVAKYGALGAGRGDLHPHALRHTCATHMLDGGADLARFKRCLVTRRFPRRSATRTSRWSTFFPSTTRLIRSRAGPRRRAQSARIPSSVRDRHSRDEMARAACFCALWRECSRAPRRRARNAIARSRRWSA